MYFLYTYIFVYNINYYLILIINDIDLYTGINIY